MSLGGLSSAGGECLNLVFLRTGGEDLSAVLTLSSWSRTSRRSEEREVAIV